MDNFYFNYKDLFKAPRKAIGPQRIGLAMLGLMAAHVVYLFFTYLAFLSGGQGIAEVWSKYGLFPCAYAAGLPFYAYIIYWIGLLLTGFILLLMNVAVARAAYMHLRENLFYTWKQALRFARGKALSVVGIFITFAFLILPFIFGAIVMALIGKIPWFGEILNSLATLPYIFAGMVLVFFTLSLFVSVFFGPVIISTSEEDGLGAAVQSLHLTWGQPWRLVFYGLIIAMLEVFGIFFFAFVLKIGLIIYSILFMPLMHSLAPILDNALRLVQISMGVVNDWIFDLLGPTGSKLFYLKQDYEALASSIPLSTVISSYIVFFFFLIAAYMTIGYGEAVGITGLVIAYVIFDKKLTDTNLLTRKDSEIEEEDEDDDQPTEEDTKNLSDEPDNKDDENGDEQTPSEENS
ncbi:hypothetical protein ACX8XP_14455 [Calditrichota bacterium LG25]